MLQASQSRERFYTLSCLDANDLAMKGGLCGAEKLNRSSSVSSWIRSDMRESIGKAERALT
jgi:hypothetical protein